MHPRLKRAFEQHSSKLEAVAPAWEQNAEELFNQIANADPSDKPAFGHGKKIHLPWLLAQMGKGQLTADNLADTHLALRLFCADPAQGDLGRYKTPEQLIEATLGPKRALIRSYLSHDHSAVQHDRWQSLHDFPASPAHRVDFILERLLDTDPTSGRHLPHLLRWLIHKQSPLLPEDLPRMRRELRLYTKYRQQIMPAEKRDLAGCASAHDLYALLKPFKPKMSMSATAYEVAEDRVLATREATLLHETDDFRLLRINTKKAAIILGKTTEWCTAYGDGDGRENRFERYSDNLMYMRSKKHNTVFQFHFGDWILNDASDDSIKDMPKFFEQHPGLKELLEPHVMAHLPGRLEESYLKDLDMRIPGLLDMGDIYNLNGSGPIQELPGLLVKAVQENSLDFVAKVLEWCEDRPVYAAAIAPRMGDILHGALQHCAPDTDYETQLDIFLTAQLKPEHKVIADAVAPRLLPEFLQAAGDYGHCAFLPRILVLERDDPAYAPHIRATAPATITASLLEAVERQRTSREFTPLIKYCAREPDYKAACLAALDNVLDYILGLPHDSIAGLMKADLIRVCSADADYRTVLERADERLTVRPTLRIKNPSSPA
jgi:hypothetical protein